MIHFDILDNFSDLELINFISKRINMDLVNFTDEIYNLERKIEARSKFSLNSENKKQTKSLGSAIGWNRKRFPPSALIIA